MLIAPAFDMTERLMWHRMSAEVKAELERDGVYYEPSLYGDPYPITKHLIEEGRNHLLGVGTLHLDLPVRILQGMCDPDVPWGHALDLVDLLCCEDVELTLIKDGDHRQSRPQDLRRLEATVAALVEKVQAQQRRQAFAIGRIAQRHAKLGLDARIADAPAPFIEAPRHRREIGLDEIDFRRRLDAEQLGGVGDHLVGRGRLVVGDIVDRAGVRPRDRGFEHARRCPRHGCG